MFRKYYKLLNSHIKPDVKLLNETKSKMLAGLEAPKPINLRRLSKLGTVAACLVLSILVVPALFKNVTAPKINSNKPQQISYNENLTHKSTQTFASDIKGQRSAIYHNMDLSLIKRNRTYNMVKLGFYFQDKLIMLAKNETGIDMNNGVHWDSNKNFTQDNLESSLNIAIKNPNLPSGDYTTKQSVLISDATNQIIAYQTIYYFFNKDTMEFKNSFSIFYFNINDVKAKELELLKNVTKVDGKMNANVFPPQTSVYFNMPHLRRMVYVENGIAIVVESSADPVLIDETINEAKSLELYEQTDIQHFNLMKSIIE